MRIVMRNHFSSSFVSQLTRLLTPSIFYPNEYHWIAKADFEIWPYRFNHCDQPKLCNWLTPKEPPVFANRHL